jgi:hypothetical protein
MIDFAQLYIKMIKYEFWKYLKQYKGYEPTKICKGTARFLKELEIISYELCKISLADVYVKRYLPSYVGAAFIITAFEVLVEDIMKAEGSATALDLNHVVEYHRIIQNLFTKLFGYDKFVMFQFFSKFLFHRFQCFFYQHSGILMQQKQEILSGNKMTAVENEYKIDKAFAQVPFLLRERITVHLHDNQMKLRFHEFFKKYVP